MKQLLTTHETIEEEIFYPALKQFAEAKDIVLEAYEEHEVVETIMGELEQTPSLVRRDSDASSRAEVEGLAADHQAQHRPAGASTVRRMPMLSSHPSSEPDRSNRRT